MDIKQLAIYLKDRFKGSSIISTGELYGSLMEIFPGLAKSTIAWKLNQLKEENLIFQSGRGHYSFTNKPTFVPNLSLKSKRVYNRIKALTDSEICLWDTKMLAQILEIEIDEHWIFIAAEKNSLENIFKNTLDLSKQVFLNPDKEVILRYLIPQKEAIILVPLISEKPILDVEGYKTPTIEGILVNAWFKRDLFLEPLGIEVLELFKKAYHKYNINRSSLLRYAARRDKRKEIEELMKKFT